MRLQKIIPFVILCVFLVALVVIIAPPTKMQEVVRGALGTVVGAFFQSVFFNLIPAPGTWGTTTPAYGIAAGGGLPGLTDAELDQRFKDMKQLGVTWVRLDIDWNNIQYVSSSESHWADYDKVIHQAQKHNFRVLGIIDYTPAWARQADCQSGAQCAPRDPAQFAAFAAQVVKRYKNQVRYWEVWNEPNIKDFWAPTPNCAAYTELLKQTYLAIKTTDPFATVIVGGLAPASSDGQNIAPIDFLQCIYTSGGRGYFDAIANHPYTFPLLPSEGANQAWMNMASSTPSLRSIMTANGDVLKKIWITEVGAPTNGPDSYWYVSEQRQADMIKDVVRLYRSYDWVGPLFWYSYKDSGVSTSTSENFFGLVRYDGSAKPAYDMFRNLLKGQSNNNKKTAL